MQGVKIYKFPIIKQINHGDVTDSMMNRVCEVAKGVHLKTSHGKKKKCEFTWWMVTRLVIMSQGIQIVNHSIVHLKLIQCYMSIIP